MSKTFDVDEFLDEVYSLSEKQSLDVFERVLDATFVDEPKDRDKLNDLFSKIDLSRISLEEVMMFLISTNIVKTYLPARNDFVIKAKEKYKDHHEIILGSIFTVKELFSGLD